MDGMCKDPYEPISIMDLDRAPPGVLKITQLGYSRITKFNIGYSKYLNVYMNQVIQAVTFSSPNVGGHLTFPKGHKKTPSQKVTIAELPGKELFCSKMHLCS